MIAALITLSVALVVVIIALLVNIYHQMLLINEVNKRLILITTESIDNERNTMGELMVSLQEQDSKIEEKFDPNTSTEQIEDAFSNFDPHAVSDDLEL